MSPDWYARHTHHWDDWSMAELLAAKTDGEHRVSLVVPARNEAATVGDVVAKLRAALMGTVDLVDEVVVIDSDSDDDTFEVAADAGAVVHRAKDIRPDLGWRPGKGEAMWKSLFVTRGDLIVFIDADLLDWDTHFVPGLLGPLFADPGVQLVKGFYERPFVSADVTTAYEGGRVTELVARPLIALHFPELAGVVQPLAGEWAVRRDHLATLHVPTGYAVEIAALIDTMRGRGLDAIAQVDLGSRAHRHQALRDLGAMAVQVMAAALTRAGMAGVSTVPAQMAGAETADAEMADAEMADAEMADAEMAGVATAPAEMVDAEMVDAEMVDAEMAGAEMAGAEMAGAEMAGAGIAREPAAATLRQYVAAGGGMGVLDRRVPVDERPPAASVPAFTDAAPAGAAPRDGAPPTTEPSTGGAR